MCKIKILRLLEHGIVKFPRSESVHEQSFRVYFVLSLKHCKIRKIVLL